MSETAEGEGGSLCFGDDGSSYTGEDLSELERLLIDRLVSSGFFTRVVEDVLRDRSVEGRVFCERGDLDEYLVSVDGDDLDVDVGDVVSVMQ